MTAVARVYPALVRAELTASAAYRAQLLAEILGWVLPFAMMALWTGAASDGPVSGITSTQFVSYYISVLVVTTVNSFSFAVIFGLGPLVHSGKLSAQLLQPLSPLHRLVAKEIANNIVRLPAMILIAVVTVAFVRQGFVGDPLRWLLAFALFAMGVVALLGLSVMVASMAFWLTKADAFQSIVYVFEFIFGGLLAPVVLLPEVVADVALLLPFWAAVGGPAELVSDMTSVGAGLRSLAVTTIWAGGLWLGARLVWARGVRRYEAVGS